MGRKPKSNKSKRSIKGRAPAFLFDTGDWNSSGQIRSMNAEQLGWYIQLLVDAWENEPQATLPNDKDRLKTLARFKRSLKEKEDLIEQLETQGQSLIDVATLERPELKPLLSMIYEKVIAGLQKSVAKLLTKNFDAVVDVFNTWTDEETGEELLYSKRQMHELKRWKAKHDKYAAGGAKTALNRWNTTTYLTDEEGFIEEHPMLGTQEKRKEKGEEPPTGSPATPTHSPVTDTYSPATSTDSLATKNNEKGNPGVAKLPHNYITKDLINNNTNTILNDTNLRSNTEANDQLNNKNKLIDQESNTNTTNDQNNLQPLPRTRRAQSRKFETLFDEEKFSLTEKMQDRLKLNYPDFEEGDWEYLVEKFKNVYYGRRYISWSRTFYNFVSNQVAQYGYVQGSYRRKKDPKLRKPDQPTAGVSRHEQRSKEAQLLFEQYEEGSAESDIDDPEALPLT